MATMGHTGWIRHGDRNTAHGSRQRVLAVSLPSLASNTIFVELACVPPVCFPFENPFIHVCFRFLYFILCWLIQFSLAGKSQSVPLAFQLLKLIPHIFLFYSEVRVFVFCTKTCLVSQWQWCVKIPSRLRYRSPKTKKLPGSQYACECVCVCLCVSLY